MKYVLSILMQEWNLSCNERIADSKRFQQFSPVKKITHELHSGHQHIPGRLQELPVELQH